MKKIGIITFHFPLNSGAVLQCLALQKKLDDMGCETIVIDYRPKYHTDVYATFRNPIKSAYHMMMVYKDYGTTYMLYRFVRNFISICVSNRYCIRRKKNSIKFEKYISKHMPLTKRYNSLNELQKDYPVFDAYISGSDQVWNSKITNDSPDLVYYMAFGEKKSRRITYAISADIKESELDTITPYVKNIHAISVRESDTKEKLEKLFKKEIYVHLDPTLLLKSKDYMKLEESIFIPEKYVMFYGLKMNDNSLLRKTLLRVVEKYNLPIVDISPIDNKIKNVKYKKNIISPGEFLSYIKNAEIIVTNSFHGVVFSIIYHKYFYVVLPSLRSMRIKELLFTLGLSSRIISVDNDLKSLTYSKIDYETVDSCIEIKREEATVYLKENLGLLND